MECSVDLATSNELDESFKQNFDFQLIKYDEQHQASQRRPWTREKIIEVINNVRQARVRMNAKSKLTSMDYYWMSKYDIVTTGNEEHLIFRKKKKNQKHPTVLIIPREEYFRVLKEAHESCGHGGRDKILCTTKDRFYIPKKAVEIFIALCPTCETKKKVARKGVGARQILSQDFIITTSSYLPNTSQSQSVAEEVDSPGSCGESPANAGGGVGGSGRGGEGTCAACGGDASTHGRRARGSPAERLIAAAILPRELNDETLLCNDCYKRYCYKRKQKGQNDFRKSSNSTGFSQRVALSEESANVNIPTPPTSDTSATPQQTIILPNYKRAPSITEGCLFPNCPMKDLHIIPQYMKQCLLRDYQLYAPVHSRVCKEHLFSKDWEPLLNIAKSDFTAQQIEDVLSILKTNVCAINFDNIEDIPPNLLLYCTGINHGQFQNILDNLPSLMRKTKTPVLALTAYLTKLRTNDSFDRLSALFQTTTSILEKLTAVARDSMAKEFVPVHLRAPLSMGKTEKASGMVTEDDRVFLYLHQHYYGDASTTQAAEALRARLENLASSILSQCRKRKNSFDSEDDSLASKVRKKEPLIKEELETNESLEVSEVAIEFEGSERTEGGVVSESSGDGEGLEQARVKEEPDDVGGMRMVEMGASEEQHLVSASKPIEDLPADTLDTVAAPLPELVKHAEDPATIKVEPGGGDTQAQATVDTSQPILHRLLQLH